jgi:Mg-chelatase subunit ChlD
MPEEDVSRRKIAADANFSSAGKKEVANPGRNGQIRHKFTHKGVIYITDETGKHEITSWRMDEANKAIEEADISEAACSGSHTVIVVDASGSMRKEDVPGTIRTPCGECLPQPLAPWPFCNG